MGLSKIGSICFETHLVMGYKRVQETPARTIRLMLFLVFNGAKVR